MSGNTFGTIAKVGVPLALTAITGGMAAPLAAATGLGETAAGALLGAATGAAGSAITGGDPLTGAALGGIGGGISGSGVLNNVFGGSDSVIVNDAPKGLGSAGADLATDAAGSNVSNTATLAQSNGIGNGIGNVANNATLTGSEAVPAASTGGIGAWASRNALPIAGGLAVLATSGNDKQSTLKGNDRQPNDVQPLQRTQIATDPNSYYGVGGARQAFDVVNPKVNPQIKYFANGGSAMPQGIGSMVQGQGDGQSDQIHAMLSDGEYVIPAPVVSALGRGSNAAGAKKLDKIKSHVMAKTYKGGKPPAARMGIGSMRAA